MILRGEKTIEYRSRPTRIIGERFYIYASKGNGRLEIGNGALTPALSQREREQLPTGVIVGTAIITGCTQNNGTPGYEWHLADVRRYRQLRKPKRHPQPVWFNPF